jgi:hypothetical protein
MNSDLTTYRKAFPRSRRTGPTAIVKSGGIQTIFDCICGSRHSCATRHRGNTRHELDWRKDHADCLRKWAETH